MTTTDEFSVIEPIGTSVEFRGATREVSPLKVGQLPKFARAIKPIGSEAFAGIINGDLSGLFDLIADHGESIIDAASVASGIDRAEIEAADIDELVQLATVIIRVNADFFAQRLTPALRQAAAQATTSGDGPTQSTP